MVWLIGILFIFFAMIVIVIVVKISSQVNERLAQMNQSLQEANRNITQGLGSAATIFGGVHEKLGRLEETNRQIIEISKDISSLQELLRAPKFRGKIGETLLENLLSQVLPKEFYQVQYRFKTGEAVDAIIRLGGRLVPIDAKFSLENFQRMQESQDENTRNSLRKKFIQDVKARVDEISAKYILPGENTFDFALMYIPAENVYYEIAITEELLSYFASQKVVPVSPNTFYAYLQVICLGLKGMKVEENARQILKDLSSLTVDINKFREDFELLGKHIFASQAKYADAARKLDKFSEQLTNIQDSKAKVK